MSKTLNDNLNIVGESGLTIELMGDDLVIIQKLDDEPNDVGGMTSSELKATFDKAGLLIQTYINEKLIPAILADDATEAARAAAEQTRESNEQTRETQEQTRIQNEQARQNNYTTVCNLVERMTVAANTLAAESSATANIVVDEVTGGYKITLGIPKGRDGRGVGDMEKVVYDPNRVQAPVAFRPAYVEHTMLASGWVENRYSFEGEYPQNSYDISIEVAPTATEDQFTMFGAAMICGSATENVATALGDVPTVDIPIIVKAVAK